MESAFREVPDHLLLGYSDELTLEPGDLHAVVKGRNLVLPRAVEQLVHLRGMWEHTQFCMLLSTHHAYFQERLGWTPDETRAAFDKLMGTLNTHQTQL